MPQFTPSGRDSVREYADAAGHVEKVGVCGDGIRVLETAESSGEEKEKCYTVLMEKHGWYVATLEPREGGNVLTLMPVPNNAASGGSDQ